MDELAQRRYQKKQNEVWEELVKATAALKDAEVHLLRANIAMEETKWASERCYNVREWAFMCEEAAVGTLAYMQLIGKVLLYSDPFSEES